MYKTSTLATAACLLLIGCVPVTTSYFRLEHEGGTRERQGCGDPGATLRFPFHGVTVTLWARFSPTFQVEGDSSSSLYLSVHVPERYSAQLATNTIRILWSTPDGPVETTASLRIWSFLPRSLSDGEKLSVTSMLAGGTTIKKGLLGSAEIHNSYYFRVQEPIVQQSAVGKIILPVLRIDGVDYEGPTVPFSLARSLYISTLGC